MPDKNSKLTGFTLIELLVTISIIAILSAIGLIAYSAVLKQGRDNKRQADLRSIQSALEQYNSDQGYYPDSVDFSGSGSLVSDSRTYMQTVPSDSTAAPNYCYKPLATGENCSLATIDCVNTGASANPCISYCLYAKLENQTAGTSSCGTGTDHDKYNLIVTPP